MIKGNKYLHVFATKHVLLARETCIIYLFVQDMFERINNRLLSTVLFI